MRHDDLQGAVAEALERAGWVWLHTWATKNAKGQMRTPTATGMPDLLCLRNRYLLAIEIKVGGDSVTLAQRLWLTRWSRLACSRAWVLREKDWADPTTVLHAIVQPEFAPTVYGWQTLTETEMGRALLEEAARKTLPKPRSRTR